MAAPVTIRPLAAADRPAWERLWRAYLTFYEATLPDSMVELTWSRLLTEGEDPRGFCAVDGETLVGIVHYLFHRSCWTAGDYCYLQDLYVDEGRRGSGVGRALIEAVYAAADRHGADYVYWLTQEFNAPARRLYDRIGEETPFIKYKRP